MCVCTLVYIYTFYIKYIYIYISSLTALTKSHVYILYTYVYVYIFITYTLINRVNLIPIYSGRLNGRAYMYRTTNDMLYCAAAAIHATPMYTGFITGRDRRVNYAQPVDSALLYI